LSPEPTPTDFAGQETNQFLWDQQVDFPFVFAFRAELEAREQVQAMMADSSLTGVSK
jgi:hypothetical protein